MSQDLKIVTNLVTRTAKAKLRDLKKKKAAGRKSLRTKIWSAAGSGVKKGAGFAAGFGTASSVLKLQTGKVDLWESMMSPVEATVRGFVDEQIGYSAIARRRAREQTVEALAAAVGDTKDTSGAVQYYQLVNKMLDDEETGRNIARQVMAGPTIDEVISEAAVGMAKLIEVAISYFYDELTS